MAWAPDYVTTDELAEFIRISDDADDAVLARAVTAASRAVDHATNRQFGLVASVEARYYTARYDLDLCRWVVEIDDLMTSTGLVVAYDSADAGTYADTVTGAVLTPRNAAALLEPWTALEIRTSASPGVGTVLDGVRVTARWGWTTVPEPIKEATLLQASRFAARRDSPYGIAGTGPQSDPVRLMSRVDPDVMVTLRPFRRVWAAC